MITILAIFCQLAFVHVHCGPSRVSRMCHLEVDEWSLSEARISLKLPDQPDTTTTPYNNGVRLIRYGSTLCIDAIQEDNVEAKNVLCFEGADIHALFEDTIYVITQHPIQFIRLTLAERNDAKCFSRFLEARPFNPTLVTRNRYKIEKMLRSDDSGNVKSVAVDTVMQNIYLTEYAEFVSPGNDSGKRRFIINGGIENVNRSGQIFASDLFAVFHGGEYNFTRIDDSARFIFEIRLDGFPEKIHYGLELSHYNNMPNKFAEEMSRYVSPDIPKPEILSSVTEHL